MFAIRSSEDADCKELYQQSKDLLKEHNDLGDDTNVSVEGFMSIHTEKFVRFQVLTSRIDEVKNAKVNEEKKEREGEGRRRSRNEQELAIPKEQVVGYITFAEDYDLHFGGRGFLVDQFFIREQFRGKGQGRRLLNCIRAEARKRSMKYIKLFYQETAERHAIYSHLGFTNVSTSPPFIHYFEVYGPEEMKSRLNIDVYEPVEEDVRTLPVKPGIDVLQYAQACDARDGHGRLGLLFSLSADISDSDTPSAGLIVLIQHSVRIHPLPGLFEVHSLKRFLSQRGIFIDDPPPSLWTQIWSKSRSSEHPVEEDVLICAFVERPTVCCWLGHQLTFCNFAGDLQMISKELLVRRIRAWSPKWGPVLGVNFEVAGEETSCPTESNNALVRLLNSLGVREDASWNCAIMPEEKIREDIED
ncbi:n acetyltransferase [Echinococcus multilocularis]|uniref:N acetyltransferase n=1 Tax=Echinococcus multilocularis TaxID=6211 RepID=A0A068Y090_ECHMU|nr:n acetyltransferase [Echinococcus multilocularis]